MALCLDQPVATLEEILFNEAIRQLGQQETVLESLRSRAIAVLGVAGVVAGLFVDHLVKHFDGFAWTAIILFLVTVKVALCPLSSA